ncbi:MULTISPECIES: GGDEF domain-containing protein [Agrobacterium]|uniref:GGDEF domain-containing protein n=1 Tax=Agrobacterium TaxID=357 RepID=UPI001572314D|nr:MULTISPECIES: diguanylate cyclase [Agrobacterium]NTJ44104.1 GGDEF domain-containing protein [Agrobacterium larrymoorei]WCK22442.1 diguanylate cyclase [Agrobacterium tumefaciens]
MPDFFTLFVVVLLLNLSHCMLWSMIAYRYRDLHAARYWLAGSAAGVVGGIALSLQGEGGIITNTVAGNGLVILGFYLNWCGSRQFHGDKVHGAWSSILVGVSVLVMLATFHAWYGRNPVYTLAQSIPLALAASYLLRRHRRDLGAVVAAIAMGAGVVSHSVIAGGNLLIVTGIRPDLQLYQAASIDLLVFLFASVVWNFGFLISAVERLHSQVEQLANEDELTGIANRRLFMTHLNRACDGDGVKDDFSLLLFDLDRFKAINDRHGHATGDAALKHVVGVIMGQLRNGDVFARIGGDEFGLLLPQSNTQDAEAVAARIVGAVKGTPLQWNALRLRVTVSIGIVTQHQSSARPETLLENADSALYQTKRRGRDGYTLFAATSDVTSNVVHLSHGSHSGSAVRS